MSNNTDRVMFWAESQGAVVYQNVTEKQRLLEYILPVAVLFPDLVKKVSAVYVYQMCEQFGNAAGSDGICWKDVTNDAGTLFAIGISVEAMDAGKEYCRFVFLHELAHIVTGHEHNGHFHNQLNKMLNVYNQATGDNLSNDMCGLPMRHDSRPYLLPENIPVQNGYTGTIFHTEARG